MNPGRDGFSIQCSGYGWVEKGEFNLMVYNAGRHGVLMSTSGSNSAFINECIWRQYVLRGVSAVTPGGNAIRMTSTATGGGSKISDHYIEKSSWDCIYNGGNPVPDVSPINIDSGIAQNFLITMGGWENTGNGGSPGTGPACNVTGSGAWNGLTLIANITNSFWGQGGAAAAVTNLTNIDYSFTRTQLMGPIQVGGLSSFHTCTGGPPSSSVGNNGDFAFRQDTPGTANQRIYVKSSGAWVGIV
jgi:hypothetical protein